MEFIGITGGVGAGKSAILAYLSQNYKCKIVMADDLAKELMEPGHQCYDNLLDALVREGFIASSMEILDADDYLDRSKMSEIVFASEKGRMLVNSIVHPAVKDWIVADVAAAREEGALDYYFFEAALLIECEYDKICDEIWYIFTTQDNRRARLKSSRGYSDERVDEIFASQLDEKVFRMKSDFVIDNNRSLDYTFEQIDKRLTDRGDL